MEGLKELAKAFLGIAIIVAVSFLIGCRYGRRTAPERLKLHVVWDTTEVVRYDTIIRERPVYLTSYVHDTVRTHFTTIHRDTVTVDVPIERRVYQEDSLYRCVISGWRPSLDSLMIFPTTTTITIRESVKTPPPKWSFGVTAGPSALVTPNGKIHGGIGATAGLTFRF